MRLNYFDYFRAIAIFLIVAGHSFSIWTKSSVLEMILANIVTGGTALFVFISGFFFHHIFYKNFDYKAFLIKKFQHVLLPYLLLSTLAFIIIVILLNEPHFLLVGDNNAAIYLKALWTGRVLTAYWYIPFICLVFIASPLFIRFIKLSNVSQLYLFFSLLIISMFVYRPSNNAAPLHSLIYYTPIYLLGIMFSIHQQYLLTKIHNKSLLLAGLVLLISLIQIAIYNTHSSFYKETIFSFKAVDIIILQKIALIFFIISVLQKYQDKNLPRLKYIASISFPIFFIHPWILFFWDSYSLSNYLQFMPGVLMFTIITLVTFTGSIILANVIKALLKKQSSYLIGW